MMTIARARGLLAVIAFSVAMTLVSAGFSASAANATTLASTSKLCQDAAHIQRAESGITNVHQLGKLVPLIRKAAAQAPQPMKGYLQQFASDVRTIAHAGGYTSKAEKTAFVALGKKITAQGKALCPGQ
jgi:hypothetical protein